MYLKDALIRCSDLEVEVADLLQSIVAASADSPMRGVREALHRRARLRAALFRSLAGTVASLEDGGPFLVEITGRLAALRRAIDPLLGAGVRAHNAEAMLEQIAATGRADVYEQLLEVAEPIARRAVRLIEVERRSARLPVREPKPQCQTAV
jgi:hypothetical protein